MLLVCFASYLLENIILSIGNNNSLRPSSHSNFDTQYCTILLLKDIMMIWKFWAMVFLGKVGNFDYGNFDFEKVNFENGNFEFEFNFKLDWGGGDC